MKTIPQEVRLAILPHLPSTHPASKLMSRTYSWSIVIVGVFLLATQLLGVTLVLLLSLPFGAALGALGTYAFLVNLGWSKYEVKVHEWTDDKAKRRAVTLLSENFSTTEWKGLCEQAAKHWVNKLRLPRPTDPGYLDARIEAVNKVMERIESAQNLPLSNAFWDALERRTKADFRVEEEQVQLLLKQLRYNRAQALR